MEFETDIPVAGSPLARVRPIDVRIAEIATRQHGVISLRQLVGHGLSARAGRDRVAAGRLHRIHRGVYAVGHRCLTIQGYRMAAVLFGGPEAVLSHRPAGAEWGMRNWSGRAAITVPSWRRNARAIEIHSSPLPADERTVLDGIPITTMPRTLLDLATVLDRHALLRAVNEAVQKQLSDSLSLPELLERHKGERGTGKLRSVLDGIGFGMGVTDRELEARFARFVTELDLPPPILNGHLQIGADFYSPDCLWPGQRLIVELHSAEWHGQPPAVSRDATRDRRLLLAGYRVIHVTWAQLHDRREAEALERDLRMALDLRPR